MEGYPDKTEVALSNETSNVASDNEKNKCVKCGAPIEDGQNFCPLCGTPKPQSGKMICQKCSAELQSGQLFCPQCGQKVGSPENKKRQTQNYSYEQRRKRKRIVLIIALSSISLIICGAVWLLYRNDWSLSRLFGGSEKNTETAVENSKSDILTILKNASKGDLVEFGSYEQNNIKDDGKEAIKWIVLTKTDNEALLLSKDILDVHLYHNGSSSVTWEKSDLRAWLNSEFYEMAFSKDERDVILSHSVSTAAVSQRYYSTLLETWLPTDCPASETNDKVFVLSVSQFDSLVTKKDRIGTPTYYARMRGENNSSSIPFEWVLRTPGTVSGTQKYIDEDGEHEVAGAVNQLYFGIRPAIYINLNHID